MNPLPKIIGFVGKKKSGKDTALELLRQMYPHQHFIRCAFADELKKEVARACNVTIEEIDSDKDLWRPILKWWGTDFKRNKFGENYWINVWLKKVKYIQQVNLSAVIVATDVRFLNEADCIKNKGGLLIRIQTVNKDFEEDLHQSEKELESIQCNSSALNDFTGGLSVLQRELAKALI